MMHAALFWALTHNWTQFEPLASDTADLMEQEMRRRFEGVVDDAELARVVAIQVESILSAAESGVVLLATSGPGTNEPRMPPPGLSLTLALANRPASGRAGESPAE